MDLSQRLRTAWTVWWDLAIRLLVLVASFASIFSVPLALSPSPNMTILAKVAIGFSAFAFAVFFVLEIAYYKRRRVFAKNDVNGIRHYMHDWIQHAGSVAIWTRDLSWANNQETRKLLIQKAKSKELVLCLPEHTALSQELENAGAEVYDYGDGNLDRPVSRFTIAGFGRDGARVAVGRAAGDVHVIEEFSMASHPAYSLAQDLVSLARQLHRNQIIQ